METQNVHNNILSHRIIAWRFHFAEWDLRQSWMFDKRIHSRRTADASDVLVPAAPSTPHEGTGLLYGRCWTGWTPTQFVGIEVTDRRIGILGRGRIGRTIARRARGFDMNVHYHNRRRLEPALEEALAITTRSRACSLHAPHSAEHQEDRHLRHGVAQHVGRR